MTSAPGRRRRRRDTCPPVRRDGCLVTTSQAARPFKASGGAVAARNGDDIIRAIVLRCRDPGRRNARRAQVAATST